MSQIITNDGTVIDLYDGAYTGPRIDAAVARALAGGEIDAEIDTLRAMVGSPLVAQTKSAMIDTGKVYVYTGSESGMVNGNWYYYDGSAWVSGGVYNAVAVQTDTTLTVAGVAADAKATGDRLATKYEIMKSLTASDDVSALSSGIYIKGSSVTPANWPSEVTGSVLLLVYQVGSSTKTQLFISYSNIWWRNNAGGSWTNLRSVATETQLTELSDVAMQTRASLAAGVDLNDLKSTGMHFCNALTSISNSPFASGARFDLIVKGLRTPAASGGCSQIAITADKFAVRTYYLSTWRPWQIVNTAEIAAGNAYAIEHTETLAGLTFAPTMEQGTFNIDTWKDTASDYYIRTANDYDCIRCRRVIASVPEGLRIYFLLHYTDGTTESVYYDDEVQAYYDLAGVDKLRVVFRKGYQIPIAPEDADGFTLRFQSDATHDFIPKTLMSSFKRYGVYSDSLSAGRVYSDPDLSSTGIDKKSISWPVMLAEKLATTVFNHSRHGQSVDTFIQGIIPTDTGSSEYVSLGDNCLQCALDGSHDVPLCIISFGANNRRELADGSAEDVDLNNCDNNADTIFGQSARLIQLISDYYAAAQNHTIQRDNGTSFTITKRATAQPIYIAILIYGQYSTNTSSKGQRDRWIGVIDTLKSTIEAQGNHLFAINLYDDRRWDSRQDFFRPSVGAVLHNHWVGISYNALSELIGERFSEFIFDNYEDFLAVELIESNEKITSYNNPTNYT